MTGPIASGAIQFYDSEADMPPAMQARLAEERRLLAAARSRYDELLLRLNREGWPAAALELVRPHAPHLFARTPTCTTCDVDEWPCWTITTAEGS